MLYYGSTAHEAIGLDVAYIDKRSYNRPYRAKETVMAKYYELVTSVDNKIAVTRPALTAAGLGNLPSAMEELTNDKVYEDDEHALIYKAGLERYFRKPKNSALVAYDRFYAAGKANGQTDEAIKAVLGERPTSK